MASLVPVGPVRRDPAGHWRGARASCVSRHERPPRRDSGPFPPVEPLDRESRRHGGHQGPGLHELPRRGLRTGLVPEWFPDLVCRVWEPKQDRHRQRRRNRLALPGIVRPQPDLVTGRKEDRLLGIRLAGPTPMVPERSTSRTHHRWTKWIRPGRPTGPRSRIHTMASSFTR
jgi:hypothetical protein